ncbi:unnamed protein product [Adineta steineri]|uniref:Caspase family p20 domain-containing protein n=1 Tax=Adineta steineri TaxID=433720 RepID=A0A815GDI4_9BILA|nr:unnamed protein product [Adineta steineri]CAF3690462.1 unnamed protein product [Adineta steineri]
MYTKHALVIGNEAYRKSPLNSCINDANDVSTMLTAMGFQSNPAANVTSNEMKLLSREFIQTIQPGSVVILYFSGHGIQYNGINYLLGINDDNVVLDRLDSSALNVQDIINSIHAKSPRLVLVILDACRGYEVSDPTQDGSRFYRRGLYGFRDGLAPMRAPPATIIVFACAEDEFSSSVSMNDRNSLYTFHLLRHLCTANTDIDQVLKNVAADVQRDPMNFLRQVPFRYSSLNESICLVGYSGMNSPMTPMLGYQGGYGYQQYQQPYGKARHVGRYFPPMFTAHDNFFASRHHQMSKRRALFDKSIDPARYDFPNLQPFYYY